MSYGPFSIHFGDRCGTPNERTCSALSMRVVKWVRNDLSRLLVPSPASCAAMSVLLRVVAKITIDRLPNGQASAKLAFGSKSV